MTGFINGIVRRLYVFSQISIVATASLISPDIVIDAILKAAREYDARDERRP